MARRLETTRTALSWSEDGATVTKRPTSDHHDTVLGSYRAAFLNEIVWAYDYGARSTRRWSAKHDVILMYARDPAGLPAEWAQDAAIAETSRLRRIADFIAGMTDRYALIEHARLFDSTPELR